MRHVSTCAILLSLLASACATLGPRTSEIDFVQGCWVQQTSPSEETTSTFSVELSEEEAVYYGSLDRPQSAGGNLSLSFSSDGAFALMAATLVLDGGGGGVVYGTHRFTRDVATGPHDRGGIHLAVFKSNEDMGGRLIIEASKDRLKISSTVGPGSHTMFDGERDGCD
jgi:hypothetical protein